MADMGTPAWDRSRYFDMGAMVIHHVYNRDTSIPKTRYRRDVSRAAPHHWFRQFTRHNRRFHFYSLRRVADDTNHVHMDSCCWSYSSQANTCFLDMACRWYLSRGMDYLRAGNSNTRACAIHNRQTRLENVASSICRGWDLNPYPRERNGF